MVSKEGPIHISNVMLIDPKDKKPTRVGVTREGGTRNRVARRSGSEVRLAMARLKDRYIEEIRPQLVERFGYSTYMQAPKIEKITLNMGLGEAKTDSKVLDNATEQLATIAGQKPNLRRARKSIAQFKVREGMPVGISVTLRRERAYEFLDRLLSVAIPRIRDFRGLKSNAFDGRGNYSMGVREQIIFPEIDYDAVDAVRGLDITITTSAKTDAEAFALLQAFGMPFSPRGGPRPRGAADGRRANALPRRPDAWPRRPSACARHAVRSTRRASTPAAAAAAARARCSASSACAVSACASSRTTATSPA